MQRDLDRLAIVTLMKSYKAKCKVLYSGWGRLNLSLLAMLLSSGC